MQSKIATTAILCLLAVLSNSQNLEVFEVLPKNQFIGAAADGQLTIEFSKPLDPATVSQSAFKVFGKWSGPAAGSFALENGGATIRFSPSEPFFAGETVNVSVNQKLRAADGSALEKGYFWQFWVKTKPGTLQQTFRQSIPLKLPGETWIQTYGAHAADLNNDGWSDLTAVNEKSDDVRILLNNGVGGFQTSNFPVLSLGNGSASPSDAGDFDGDGEIDLVVTTAHHNETRVLFGDGQGNFAPPVIYFTGSNTRAVAVVDLDFDGDDDIITANRSGSDMSILKNDGTGVFSVSQVNPTGNGESALVVTEANNDGLPDLFLGFYGSKKVALLLGDGTGTFTLSDEKTVSGNPWMIACGDWNSDGLADVVSANSTGNQTVVIFGQTNGTLSAPKILPVPNHLFPIATDAGDLDGDGDLELVTSNYESNNYSVFQNDGAGNFTWAFTLPAEINASCSILHDRDNDGDLDITGTDENADVILLFENTGTSSVFDFGNRGLAEIQISPNPVACGQAVSLKFPGEESSGFDEANVLIFNNLGQRVNGVPVSILKNGNPGEAILNFENGGLPGGFYFLEISVGGKIARGSFSVF